ncbi:MAG TPA: SaoD/DsrE family protein [Vicinamibacterales bacterium]|jgi:hypothetical protein
MKVAYVFQSPRASSYILGKMILPQMEAGTHGVDVVGMFFFHDNTFVLRKGDPLGERLSQLAQKNGMLLMMCDACAMERNLAEGELRWCDAQGNGRTQPADCRPKDAVAAAQVGCFPDLYKALSGSPPDQVITL